MKTWKKIILCLMLALASFCLHGQTDADDLSDASQFPSFGNGQPMDKALIDEAIQEARETDTEVTVPQALMYKGLMLSQMDQWDDAIPFLEEALLRDPSMLAAWEGLGWAYIKTGQQPRARKLWTYFRNLMPSESLPYNLLAQEAILRGSWNDADMLFKTALEHNPKQFELRYWYAQNLLRTGQPEKAETIFRELIKEEPDRLDIQVDLANLLTNRLLYDDSVEIWRHVNEELPGNPGYMLDQARMELRVGELRAADQLCVEAMALATNLETQVQQTDMLERAVQLRTEIATVENAEPERLAQIISTATNLPQFQASLYMQLASRCDLRNQQKPGSYPESQILSYMRKSVELDPEEPNAQALYAERLVSAKQYAEAKRWAVKVLTKFNPNHVRSKMVLFEIALAQNQYEIAEQVLEDRYMNYDSTDPMRFYYEARLQMFRGDYNEAMRLLDKMEAAANQGAVFTLLYHDLTESDWMPRTSVRRFQEQLLSLQQEGFIFISPADIPQYIGLKPGESRKDPGEEMEKAPWLARAIDTVRYEVTGFRKYSADGVNANKRRKPMKLCAVTFDEGYRSAFTLGTPVAESLGVPFAMMVSTAPRKEYVPALAGWHEIKEYASTGAWVIGSHLHEAHIRNYTTQEQNMLRHPLPNRVWLPDKNRIESMNEWDRRMRREFRLSREELRRYMAEDDCPVPMVSVPEGDVGQTSVCNLSNLRNPPKSILSEASRTYKIGFLQEPSGYTTAGDNLMMVRRYEPNWTEEGADIVNHAYEFHPSFMARRCRVEIAFLMDRPHLATELLDSLRRDGYPEDLCRKIAMEVRQQFRNRPKRDIQPLTATTSQPSVQSVAGGSPDSTTGIRALEETALPREVAEAAKEDGSDEEGPSIQLGQVYGEQRTAKDEKSDFQELQQVAEFNGGGNDPWIKLGHPIIGFDVMDSKANDQFEMQRYAVRFSANLNNSTQLGAEFSRTRIEQAILPRWNSIITDYTPGDDTYEMDPRSYTFSAWRQDLRLRLAHRFDSGAVLSASIGQAKYDFAHNGDGHQKEFELELEDKVGTESFTWEEDDNEIIGDLTAVWSPRDDLNLRLYYIRDVVVSAIKMYTSDSVGGAARWRPADWWQMDLRSQYWSYEDDNAMYFAELDSFWETMPEMNVWFGLDLSNTTSSDASDYYWTPYWDQRIMGVLRYLQVWQGYSFRFDFLAGRAREAARPLRRSSDAMLSSSSPWDTTMGFATAYTKRLNDHWDVYMEGAVMALHDYIDHRFLIGANLSF